MKTLGLIGGLTCESTAVYYDLLHKEVRKRLGPDNSSQLLLWSFDYAKALPLFLHDKPGYIDAIVGAGETLKKAGVEALMICSNSAHMGASKLAEQTGLPVIHILDAIANAMRETGVSRPLVLGTSFVMEGEFYIPGLAERLVIEPHVPNQVDRKHANAILFDELAYGEINPSSKQFYLDMIDKAAADGADSVVLGCTEHCLLLGEDDHILPMFDSTALHVKAAVDFQLG